MTSTVTMDFRDEYEAERAQWLSRRVLWFCWACLALFGVVLVRTAIVVTLSAIGVHGSIPQASVLIAAALGSNAMSIAVLIGVLTRVNRSGLSTEQLYRLVFWTIVAIGLLNLVPEAVGSILAMLGEGDAQAGRGSIPLGPLIVVFYIHLLASFFVAWTPRQAIRPLIPLLIASALVLLCFSTGPWGQRILWIVLSPVVGAPGVLIGWWRHGRFRRKFQFKVLRGHYGTMKRELTDARRIHDVLFPPRIAVGPVRFEYQYEPMREIGGDYLYTCQDESRIDCGPRLSVVIIDVTGHGISAALTVNRIHGELERLFGERSDLAPGPVLTALNHYFTVALAKHNVYATALCLRIDPQDEVVEWASAGHPPAFTISAGGLVDRLESTAMMLGACSDGEFDSDPQTMPFRHGDAVIAYTDGVIEARNQSGKMFTIEGMQRVIATLASSGQTADRAQRVLRAVQDHRFGAIADDTLIVELSRPMEARPAAR